MTGLFRNFLIVAIMAGAVGMAVKALPAQAQQKTLGITAVVNDDAISARDVEERTKLVVVSSGLPDNAEIRARVKPQVLEGLIEEQLKLQEAARNNITIGDEEVAEGLATIAQQNEFTADQFRQILGSQGVPIKTLEHQIRAQLAWNEVISSVLRRQVNVTTRDVDTRLERMKGQLGRTEYLVAEIFLPFDDSTRASELQQFASRMATELQQGRAPFGPVAAQFSKAAGAEKGGLIGWVQEGQLEPDLDKVLVKMEPGQVSDPIRTTGGIYLLNLQRKRTLSEDTIPARDELTNQIGFERLDRVQQKALLDLKASAFIDRRD